MKKVNLFLSTLSILIFSSFTSNIECAYTSSNLGSATSQIKIALKKEDINQIKFYTYKAIKTLEKSKKTLKKCGCESANTSFDQSLSVLKLATKSTSLNGIKSFLNTSKELIENSLLDINEHDSHDLNFKNDTPGSPEAISPKENSAMVALHIRIDASLEDYSRSIDKVAETVNCQEAKTFAERIIKECETHLLKENLTEGKKYYHLRTKQITAAALEKIGNCSN